MPQHFHRQHLYSVRYNEICSKFICDFAGWNVSTWPPGLAVSPRCMQTSPRDTDGNTKMEEETKEQTRLFFPSLDYYGRLYSIKTHRCWIYWVKPFSEDLPRVVNLRIPGLQSRVTTTIQKEPRASRTCEELAMSQSHYKTSAYTETALPLFSSKLWGTGSVHVSVCTPTPIHTCAFTGTCWQGSWTL